MSLGTPQIYSNTDIAFNLAISQYIPPIRAQLVSEALAVFVGMSEYIVLFPREYRLWERIIKTRDFRPNAVPLWLPIRHALFVSSVNLMFRAWDTSMPSNFVCGMMAIQTGMLSIVLIALTSFVLAYQTQALFSKLPSSTSKQSRNISLIFLRGILLILVLIHVAVAFTWIVLYYLKQGGWSYDRETGVCNDPKGLNLEFNRMIETMKPEFYVALIGTILYSLCLGVATYCYQTTHKSTSKSYIQVLSTTPNFGRFFFSLMMIVTLNIVTLLVGALGSIWFTLSVLSINAALVIRILLGEESEKGSTTSLALRSSDHNGNGNHHNFSVEGNELSILDSNRQSKVVKNSGIGSSNLFENETLTLRNANSNNDFKIGDGPLTPGFEANVPILENSHH